MSCVDPGGLEPGYQESEADRDRHEEEVIGARDAELPPRKIEHTQPAAPVFASVSMQPLHSVAICASQYRPGAIAARLSVGEATVKAPVWRKQFSSRVFTRWC